MTEAWIVQAVRSPIGRAHPEQGIFRFVRPDDLSADILKNLVERSGIDPNLINDVFGAVPGKLTNKVIMSPGRQF